VSWLVVVGGTRCIERSRQLGGIPDGESVVESVSQLIPYLLLIVLTAIPAWRLFERTGMSRWWTLLSVVLLGMIIILWVAAYARWHDATHRDDA